MQAMSVSELQLLPYCHVTNPVNPACTESAEEPLKVQRDRRPPFALAIAPDGGQERLGADVPGSGRLVLLVRLDQEQITVLV